MPIAVVVLAAGSGSRVGAPLNKVLLPWAGSTVLGISLRTVLGLPDVARVVLVARPGELAALSEAVEPELDRVGGEREVVVVDGGPTRHASEWQGIRALAGPIGAGELDVVVVHDAARPLAPAGLYAATIDAAREHGGAIPVAALTGLLTTGLTRVPVPDDTRLAGVQTPQAFRAQPLLAAYVAAERDGYQGTDTAGCFRAYSGLPVVAVPSDGTNLKVTFAEDLAVAAALHAAASA